MKTPAPHAARQILARNLRRLRREHGLTQEAVSYETGLSQTYLSEVESGKRNIGIDNVELLAAALKTSISELLAEN
jgi:transcriptional regulator with XRE-family HTH domain